MPESRRAAYRRGALAALALLLAPGALAEDTDIKAAREAREKAQAEADRLNISSEALRGETQTLSARLAEIAARVRKGEAELDRLDAGQAGLSAGIAALEASLESRRDEIARTLSALAGVSRVPPLAVIARPGEVQTARLAASALAGLRPGLEARMAVLRQELDELDRKRRDLAESRAAAAAALAALQADRSAMSALLDQKRTLAEKAATAARIAGTRAQELARKVETLTALLQELERLQPVAAPAVNAPKTGFGSLRGRLPLPASGRRLHRFGEASGDGRGNGMVFSTRSAAVVTAPHDAIVRFAGEFRSYGRLLILDFGDGYHLLVAGLSGIDVVVGQWLLAGEPVGRMPDITGGKRPELYLELRRKGSPIDPGPWLATRQGKTSG